MKKWDQRFLELAAHVAEWSKDPSTKVGAVIVDDQRRVLSLGYNGFPRHVNDDPERYADKMVKYKMIVHSELNAILNASKSISGSVLYCTKFPCSDCAKAIIQQGIYRVVAPRPEPDNSWAQDAAFSRQMMTEAAIVVEDVWT